MTTVPTIEGPVTGGAGVPFGAPTTDLAAKGYVMEEFLLDGVAGSWAPAPGATIGLDGHWDVVPGPDAPYRTRMYVVRPADPERFNGVVVVNWQNVTAGQDLGMPQREIYEGYAWVGVTAQRVAIEGLARGPFGERKGLPATDPARYGSLRHPGDAHSYDIVTQAARLVAPGRAPGKVDPLGGLEPRLLLASGGSQSAMRLGSYLNLVQGRERLFDGFLLTVHWGMCPLPPDQKLTASFAPVADGLTAGSSRIRDDHGTPVLSLCSESETLNNAPVRQPDSETYRFWEMAGSAHAAGAGFDALFPSELLGALSPNQVVWDYVVDAALRHLVRWVDGGEPPPHFPPIDVGPAPSYTITRDEWGNATGGLRLPEVEAPLGTHRGGNDGNPALGLIGETVPFTAEQVTARWSGSDEYVAAWDAAVEALLAAGLDLDEQAPALRARGRAVAGGAFP